MSFWSDLRSRFLGHGDVDDAPWPEETAAPDEAVADEVTGDSATPEGAATEASTDGDTPPDALPDALTADDCMPADNGTATGEEGSSLEVESSSWEGATDDMVAVVPPIGEQPSPETTAEFAAGPDAPDLAESEQPSADASTDAAGIDVAARQERAAGLILDDEGLRGDLTDDEFQPLLSWALEASDRVAATSATPDDEAAHEQIAAQVAVVKDAVALAAEAIGAHVNGKDGQRRGALAALAELASSPAAVQVLGEQSAAATLALSDVLDADSGLDGMQLAGVLAQALAGALPQEHEHAESAEPGEGAG